MELRFQLNRANDISVIKDSRRRLIIQGKNDFYNGRSFLKKERKFQI